MTHTNVRAVQMTADGVNEAYAHVWKHSVLGDLQARQTLLERLNVRTPFAYSVPVSDVVSDDHEEYVTTQPTDTTAYEAFTTLWRDAVLGGERARRTMLWRLNIGDAVELKVAHYTLPHMVAA